jgi:competence ComEA-like helix-hairpin-helix protein
MGRTITNWAAAALVVAGLARIVAAQAQTPSQAPPQQRTFTPEEIAALSQGLPEGKARELMVRVCAQCHEPQRAASVRLTHDGWEGVVSKMMGLGAKMTDDEYTQIVDYLAENYKGEAPKPINMNSATSIELESVAGLLRKEAAAWIAYRNKNGPCKSLDDFKKVEGVPFKKIDERRDRLVCF